MRERGDALIDAAAAARRGERAPEALRLAADAVALCRKAGDKAQLGRALAMFGQIERDEGRGDAALAHYEEAAALAREGRDGSVLAHRLRHIGDIHQDAGRLDLAEPCYEEALALYGAEASVPALDRANALRPMALLKQRIGDSDAAVRLWTQAGALYAEAEIEAGVAECSAHLARLAAGGSAP